MGMVLVVDDEKLYRNFLDRYLTKLGMIVFTLGRGDQALQFTRHVRIDLILLDACLKEGPSGHVTLLRLKAHEATKNVPIVMISGRRDTPEDDIAARRDGAALFVTKGEISDGIGTRSFERRIRALIQERQQAPVEIARPAHNLIPGPGRVLVVEDEPAMADLLESQLRQKGYTVLKASGALEGLRKARHEHPDLVLMDTTLHDMDGLEACEQLKSNPATQHLPVIILTAHATSEARIQSIQRSASYFMTKPIENLDEFHAIVAALLGQRPLNRTPRREKAILRFGDALVIDSTKQTISIGARCIENPSRVLFRLLWELANRPGETRSREHLSKSVWGKDQMRPRIVDLNVRRLRQLLGEPIQHWIVTVVGQGYCLIPGVVAPLMPAIAAHARGKDEPSLNVG
jgi:DNA-binding response OmpR family regulator